MHKIVGSYRSLLNKATTNSQKMTNSKFCIKFIILFLAVFAIVITSALPKAAINRTAVKEQREITLKNRELYSALLRELPKVNHAQQDLQQRSAAAAGPFSFLHQSSTTTDAVVEIPNALDYWFWK